MKIESNKNWTTCLRLNTGDGSPRVFLLNSHFLGSVPWLYSFFQKEVITMDFRVIGDTYRYGVRVTAIVVRDGKLLTYKVEDQNHLVGGAILVGEASRKAVAREVKEELGVDCEVEELMFVVENRFDYKGELHHMIEFHYKVTLLGEVPSHTLDEGKYKCEWIELQRLSEYDIRPQYLIKELPLSKSGIKQIEIG